MTKEHIVLNPNYLKSNEMYKNINAVKYQFLFENSIKNTSVKAASTNKIYEKKSSDEGYDSPKTKLSLNVNESRLSNSDKRHLSYSSEPKSRPPTRLPSIRFDYIEPLKPTDQQSSSIIKFKSDVNLNAKTSSQSNLRKSNRSSTDFGSEIDCTSTADDDDVFITTSDIIKIDKKSKQSSPVRSRRTILSESELKALNLSEKFMKDAKKMIFLPETNSFCPRNTFYYLNASNDKK
ncbi:hypothetical protein BpHYR1_023272 [Brachionus plicatilis]|uniref:Uncharacterized protein n=1 Tax=Brachionus plicatilis TaxID=10195 RepID=A0A3M7Q4L6_BRAPC|nr:hypothetical protein BpHYR1_023272 [Brachionus plicatilis]